MTEEEISKIVDLAAAKLGKASVGAATSTDHSSAGESAPAVSSAAAAPTFSDPVAQVRFENRVAGVFLDGANDPALALEILEARGNKIVPDVNGDPMIVDERGKRVAGVTKEDLATILPAVLIPPVGAAGSGSHGARRPITQPTGINAFEVWKSKNYDFGWFKTHAAEIRRSRGSR